MAIEKLNFEKKQDNPTRVSQIVKANLPSNQYSRSSEYNAIAEKINEMIPELNAGVSGYQGKIYPTDKKNAIGFYFAAESGMYPYAGNFEINIAEGINHLMYDGNKWDKMLTPIEATGKVEDGNMGIISGGEVYSFININYDDYTERVIKGAYVHQNYSLKEDGLLYPNIQNHSGDSRYFSLKKGDRVIYNLFSTNYPVICLYKNEKLVTTIHNLQQELKELKIEFDCDLRFSSQNSENVFINLQQQPSTSVVLKNNESNILDIKELTGIRGVFKQKLKKGSSIYPDSVNYENLYMYHLKEDVYINAMAFSFASIKCYNSKFELIKEVGDNSPLKTNVSRYCGKLLKDEIEYITVNNLTHENEYNIEATFPFIVFSYEDFLKQLKLDRIKSISSFNLKSKVSKYEACQPIILLKNEKVEWNLQGAGVVLLAISTLEGNVVYESNASFGEYINSENDYLLVQGIQRAITHENYITNFNSFVKVSDYENPIELDIIPILKCMREETFLDGTQKKYKGYLWQKDDSFYYSKYKKSKMTHVFTWDYKMSKGIPPLYYSMSILENGDILCVYRTEYLNTSTHDDSVRQNPILYIKSKGYTAIEIDFKTSLKPSGWLSNNGFVKYPNKDIFFIVEYTRPSVRTANVWRIEGDHTKYDNWKVVKSFELSGSSQSGFKHIHNIDVDPFTGILYFSTGDDSSAASIWYSKDLGKTWNEAINGSEKHCRLLNFIFTKDYIYWTTDSGSPFIFRAKRNNEGYFTLENIEELAHLSGYPACYCTVYLQELNCLVILFRHDGSTSKIDILIYDINTKMVSLLDSLYHWNNASGSLGFRCECIEYHAYENNFICGFSEPLGLGSYRNEMKVLGNNRLVKNKKVDNLLLSIGKNGNNYYVNYTYIN